MFPIMTSHKPLDILHNANSEEQWKVWVAFHFLPGNQLNSTAADSPYARYAKLTCRPGNDANAFAQAVLANALASADKPYFQHLVGTAAHVFADTFSHYGFIGLSNRWNRVCAGKIDFNLEDAGLWSYVDRKLKTFKARIDGTLAESIPVGHGAVATLPDRPYLKWEFVFERHEEYAEADPNRVNRRDNPATFLEASKRLHSFFMEVATKLPEDQRDVAVPWKILESDVRTILAMEGDEEKRVKAWLDYIYSNKRFAQPAVETYIFAYDPDAWDAKKAQRSYKVDNVEANACNFIRAARVHRNFVLYTLLPDAGLILA